MTHLNYGSIRTGFKEQPGRERAAGTAPKDDPCLDAIGGSAQMSRSWAGFGREVCLDANPHRGQGFTAIIQTEVSLYGKDKPERVQPDFREPC